MKRALAPAEPMTSCACHGVSFAEIARRMKALGRSFEEAREALPCARTCTACLPDLTDYLRRRGPA